MTTLWMPTTDGVCPLCCAPVQPPSFEVDRSHLRDLPVRQWSSDRAEATEERLHAIRDQTTPTEKRHALRLLTGAATWD